MRWPMAALCAALFACADTFTSPRYVNVVRLVPDSVDLVAGETIEIAIQAFDQNRDSLPDRVGRTDLYSQDPLVAEVVTIESPFATIRAIGPGRTFIVGQLGFGLSRAVIRVTAGASDQR